MARVLKLSEVKELVLGKRTLVTVDANDSLTTALKLFQEHHVTSMPVRNRRLSAPHQTEKPSLKKPQALQSIMVHPSPMRFVGMLSVVDVAIFLAEWDGNKGARGDDGEMVAKTLGDVKVADVMGKSEETRQMVVVDPHASVWQAMLLLGAGGFHRGLVPNICPGENELLPLTEPPPKPATLAERRAEKEEKGEEGEGEEGAGLAVAPAPPMPLAVHSEVTGGVVGEEYRVLSQMDVAAFLLSHEGLMGLALAKRVDDLGLVWPLVVTITPSDTLLHAFRLFRRHQVTALPVVAAHASEPHAGFHACEEVLIDTLSASDVRCIHVLEGGVEGKKGHEGLKEEKKEGKKEEGKGKHGKKGKERKGHHAKKTAVRVGEEEFEDLGEVTVGQFLSAVRTTQNRHLITCTRNTSLRRVLHRMVRERVHRVWVVDQQEQPSPMPSPRIPSTSIFKDNLEDQGHSGNGKPKAHAATVLPAIEEDKPAAAEEGPGVAAGEEGARLAAASLLHGVAGSSMGGVGVGVGGGSVEMHLQGVVSLTDILRIVRVLPIASLSSSQLGDLGKELDVQEGGEGKEEELEGWEMGGGEFLTPDWSIAPGSLLDWWPKMSKSSSVGA
ncbi:unnamed protein product [Closterium sp. Yama58-4]|nr:unnamed protein product [Closterium sp. Yama58-4]